MWPFSMTKHVSGLLFQDNSSRYTPWPNHHLRHWWILQILQSCRHSSWWTNAQQNHHKSKNWDQWYNVRLTFIIFALVQHSHVDLEQILGSLFPAWRFRLLWLKFPLQLPQHNSIVPMGLQWQLSCMTSMILMEWPQIPIMETSSAVCQAWLVIAHATFHSPFVSIHGKSKESPTTTRGCLNVPNEFCFRITLNTWVTLKVSGLS